MHDVTLHDSLQNGGPAAVVTNASNGVESHCHQASNGSRAQSTKSLAPDHTDQSTH